MPISRLAASLAFALLAGSAMAQSATVEGTWVSEGGHATFEASLCGDGTQLCGTLISLSEDTVAPLLEPLVGQQVVSNAVPLGEGKWEASTILGPSVAKGIITMLNPDRIEVEGCLLEDCRTLGFDRVQPTS